MGGINLKTGLVLEGGAMRGIYTAGVLDVLMEHGIYTDGVLGVSAGAIHGCSYVSRQRGRSIRYYMKYCRKWYFMSFRSLLLTGNLVNTRFCYEKLPETIDPFDYDAYHASGIKFYVTCTNLRTGKAEYICCDRLREQMDYMRASASMPLVSRTVWINGQPYLDGGVADSIPLEAFQKLGYEKNIVVLTQVDGYQKTATRLSEAKHAYRKFPKFQKALHDRPQNYNRELVYIAESVQKGDTFVIRPSRDLHIGRMEKDRKRLLAMYKLGRRDAKKNLPQIRKFLADAKTVSSH